MALVDGAFELLKGQTILSVRGLEVGSELVEILTTDLNKFTLWFEYEGGDHNVAVVDIIGDPADIIGHQVMLAEETMSEATASDARGSGYHPEAMKWTFYRIRTHGGDLTFRWLGGSTSLAKRDYVDVYYCIDVDIELSSVELAELSAVELARLETLT